MYMTKSVSQLNNSISESKKAIETYKEKLNDENISSKDKKKYNLLISKANKNIIKCMNELEDIKKENE